MNKSETLNPKFETNPNLRNSKPKKYDLEDRTLSFTERVRDYVSKLPKTLTNIEFSRQLIRSAGSVGANYIEANEALSKKDFVIRVKISRKEAKESRYWLKLAVSDKKQFEEKDSLISEATELMNIFGAILSKTQ
ncbi:four helix bundle protein [Candidatus Omnitrophota bacterium]